MTRLPVLSLVLLGLTVAGCGSTGRPTSGAIRPQPLPAASQASSAPKPEPRPYTVRSPAGDRSDEYYWLRDDTRENPEVLALLAQENAYADRQLAALEDAKRDLYRELVARIPQN